MCLVVDYSEKSVKSDYLGVIIRNGGEKSEKSGYSQIKMQNTLQIHTKTPKNWVLPHKITQFKHFQAEYT